MKKLFIIICLLLASVMGLTACKKDNSVGSFDAITKKCTLEVNYTGKNFFKDGIGEAKLTRPTDGDTAQFSLKLDDASVVIRFYGIDTPESTGGVEKWGKSASLFVKGKLEGATEIVLEASTTPASVDNYGSRYLAYVWYRSSSSEAFKNLNLEVVENGYSKNKCINTPAFKYYSSFKKAEDFAAGKKLHLWGEDEDPNYSTKAINLTIKELLDNIDQYYNTDTESGAKVRISKAYITEMIISSSSSPTFTYVAKQLIDGQEYSLKIYAGYASGPAVGHLLIGNQYTMTGTVQKYNGSYQLSGIQYVAMQSGGDYLTQTRSNYYMTFNNSIKYISDYGTSLYSAAEVVSASLSDGVLTIKAKATQKGTSSPAEPQEFTFTVATTETINTDSLVGKLMTTTGLQEVKDSNNIKILKYSDVVFN